MFVSRIAAVVLLSLPSLAFATNGYFSHGTSAGQKAMAGAGTALPNDAFIGTLNPAGAVWVGDAFEVGLSLFSPIRDYSASERGDDASNGIFTIQPITKHRSHNEFFPIPALSYNRAWGERASWGVTLYGNGGMNTEYNGNLATFGQGLTGFEAECEGGFGGAQATGPDNAGFCGGRGDDRFGVDLIVMFVAPTFSYKLNERISVGVSPLLAMSRFAAYGLEAFAKFSNAPDQVSNQGHDLAYGGGARVGVMTKLLPGVTLGASYQSRVWMTEFEDYQGLFAEQGDFDIPSNWNVGLALRLTHAHTVALDYQHINYNEIDSVGLPFDANDFVNNCAIPRLLAGFGFGQATASDACLGADRGPGFAWQDMDVWKLGYQYETGRYKFRAGYSRTDQPIESSQVLFNVLAPGVIEEHFTLGLGVEWSKNFFVDVALMYAPERPVSGPNPLSNTDANLLGLFGQGLGLGGVTGVLGQDTSEAFGADPDDQILRLNMRQYEATVSFGWRY